LIYKRVKLAQIYEMPPDKPLKNNQLSYCFSSKSGFVITVK